MNNAAENPLVRVSGSAVCSGKGRAEWLVIGIFRFTRWCESDLEVVVPNLLTSNNDIIPISVGRH